MNEQELRKLIKAVKNIKNENDTFYISGKDFYCRWNGKNFIWKTPSGNIEEVTQKEVIEFIGDGRYIIDYCYDYD